MSAGFVEVTCRCGERTEEYALADLQDSVHHDCGEDDSEPKEGE